jgi:hypothetical protein
MGSVENSDEVASSAAITDLILSPNVRSLATAKPLPADLGSVQLLKLFSESKTQSGYDKGDPHPKARKPRGPPIIREESRGVSLGSK